MPIIYKNAFIVGLLGLLASSGVVHGSTIDAGSCEYDVVKTAVGDAVDGDTVTVGAGTCTWNKALEITDKTIILRGAGSHPGGTKIIYAGSGHTLIKVIAGDKKGLMDVAGFWLVGGDSDFYEGSAMQISGPVGWKNVRIHHMVFDNNEVYSVKIDAETHGLIDHCTFRGSAHGIKSYGLGATDWAAPLELGTADFFFVEDNTFNWNDWYGVTGAADIDQYAGGRVVFRYNRSKYGFWETHDKARSQLVSANAYEVYKNDFWTKSAKWKGLDLSAGTGVVWGNTFTGEYTHPIGLLDYKSFDPRSVRLCDGTDPADQNTPGESGWRCQYQIGSQGEGRTARGFPLYFWSNTHNGDPAAINCTDGCQHIKLGRDYVNNGTTAKPDYVPFVHPHPLQAVQTGPVPDPPANIRLH